MKQHYGTAIALSVPAAVVLKWLAPELSWLLFFIALGVGIWAIAEFHGERVWLQLSREMGEYRKTHGGMDPTEYQETGGGLGLDEYRKAHGEELSVVVVRPRTRNS
jgi:hypothetical protein